MKFKRKKKPVNYDKVVLYCGGYILDPPLDCPYVTLIEGSNLRIANLSTCKFSCPNGADCYDDCPRWLSYKQIIKRAERIKITKQLTELKKPDFNQFGYVIYDSPAVKELGLNAGDKVMIMKHADYRMKVDGKEVYRTHIDHIYATGF